MRREPAVGLLGIWPRLLPCSHQDRDFEKAMLLENPTLDLFTISL
jgi:hypothetical protein